VKISRVENLVLCCDIWSVATVHDYFPVDKIMNYSIKLSFSNTIHSSFPCAQAEVNADQINALLEATGNTEVEAFYPIIFANFLSDPAKMAALIAMPSAGGGGGGGAGPAGAAEGDAAEEAKEEEVEEEAEIGGGIDMFGGGAR